MSGVFEADDEGGNMIDCYKYNLSENVRACFVDHWWETGEFWTAFWTAFLVIGFILLIGYLMSQTRDMP
jgi:hypothetical protein